MELTDEDRALLLRYVQEDVELRKEIIRCMETDEGITDLEDFAAAITDPVEDLVHLRRLEVILNDGTE